MQVKDTDRIERQGVHLTSLRLEQVGFAMREQHTSDYGIDAVAEFIEREKATGRLLGIQVKAGSSYFVEQNDDAIIYRPDSGHVEYWLNHTLPVAIVLCDVENEVAYWQRLASDTIQSTGKGFKVSVPKHQVLNESARGPLAEAMTPYVAKSDYTIFRTEDTSHALAKRYTLRIVLNRSMTKPEIAAVVRDMTARAAKRRYSRNEMVAGRWGTTDAHVVWTFIFASAEDEKRSSYLCRSLWIDPELDPEAAPSPFSGENVGDGIIVDWQPSPLSSLPTRDQEDFDKEHYMQLVEPLVQEVQLSLVRIQQASEKWGSGTIDEEEFLSQTADERARIDQAYKAYGSSPTAPFECEDLDGPVGSFLSVAQNIGLYHDTRGRDQWPMKNRLYLTRQALTDAARLMQRIKYELEKIR